MEALRTAALAKRTRDASSTRARLSLSAQRFRGVGQGGWCGGVSGSSPQGRPAPYFKRRCEQQPSPNARETRPPRGRVFRFLRMDFEGWARVAGHAVSRGLNHGVARLPPLADRMGRKSLRVSRGAGCWVKTGSVPLERSLPPGSAPLVRSRPVANGDPRVMTLLTRRGESCRTAKASGPLARCPPA
jgi:hypothetical protein